MLGQKIKNLRQSLEDLPFFFHSAKSVFCLWRFVHKLNSMKRGAFSTFLSPEEDHYCACAQKRRSFTLRGLLLSYSYPMLVATPSFKPVVAESLPTRRHSEQQIHTTELHAGAYASWCICRRHNNPGKYGQNAWQRPTSNVHFIACGNHVAVFIIIRKRPGRFTWKLRNFLSKRKCRYHPLIRSDLAGFWPCSPGYD